MSSQLSPHFGLDEFRCHHCGRVTRPPQALIDVLERIRAKSGKPLKVVSGTRCSLWNRHVGGARNSRHLYGDAADLLRGVVTVSEAIEAGAVGVGHDGRWVVHVDTRPGKPVVFEDHPKY